MDANDLALLGELLDILHKVEELHKPCDDSEELIEPWTPSDMDYQIDCPELNVGLLRRVSHLRAKIKQEYTKELSK